MSYLPPTTPSRSKTAFNPTTPTASRLASSTNTIQASPHYTTTRRHSLYGVEDRIVIDPGSRLWKVGFSGEGKPRHVFHPGPMWQLKRAQDLSEREEEDRILQVHLERCLRSVFHDSLLTDPKARKVILVEHPLLPIYIKDLIARILFENLQVPSVSFASSHLLALLAVGRITGLVLDCGNLESSVLPIFAARPLYPHLRTTPLAGAYLTSHLRALILLFGHYLPPTSLSGAVNIPAANRSTRVPQEVLTDSVMEDIKTRCCFVGGAFQATHDMVPREEPDQSSDDFHHPPSSDATQSESEFEHSNVSSYKHSQSSEFSSMSNPRVIPGHGQAQPEGHLQALATLYTKYSTATDIKMRVVPPAAQSATLTGNGTLVIPGWIRERAADILFEGGDVDESSVAEVILDSLIKVPVDLRKTMASSILVIGGTCMVPGFIPRLHAELLRALSPPEPAAPPSTPHRTNRKSSKPPAKAPQYDPYAPLRPLIPYIAILNNPSAVFSDTELTTERAMNNAGKAPAFSPALMAWIGGSLAGALKTGGAEVPREKWDEDDVNMDKDVQAVFGTGVAGKAGVSPIKGTSILPDWSRTPMSPATTSGVGTSPQAARA